MNTRERKEQQQRERDRIDAVTTALADLSISYLDLFEITARSSRGTNYADAIKSSGTNAPIPVRADVVDLITQIEAWISEAESVVRVELYGLERVKRHDVRARHQSRGICHCRSCGGARPDMRTLDAIRWLQGTVATCAEHHYLDWLEDVVWRLRKQAMNKLDVPELARPLSETCPDCGLKSLVARPADFVVVCANPQCRTSLDQPHIWRLGERLAKHD